MNIRIKLTLQFTLLVASILLAFSMVIYYFASDKRTHHFYGKLETRAYNISKLLIEVNEIDTNILRTIESHSKTDLFEEKILIYNTQNKLIYQTPISDTSKHFLNELNNIRIKKKVETKNDEIQTIGFSYTYKNEEFVVFASAIDQYGLYWLSSLKTVLILGYIISMIFVLAAGLFFSSKAMLPIIQVINQVEKITVSKLNLRVNEGNKKDEIAHLAITFNKMLQRIENAFQLQQTFVSNASHELRTPLTSITGQIEVTLMKDRTIEEYKEILNSIFDDISSLNKLSNGLLELTQSSVDRNSLTLVNIRIDELVMHSRSELLKRKNHYTITIDFDEYPENENNLIIQGNSNLLQVVFINLIDNACKFISDHKASITILLSQSDVIIKIADHGIGIPTEEHERIFETFYRGKNTKNIAGHGIGLSLARKIIDLHHGQIQINSQLESGTIVKISLPLFKAQ